MFSSLNEYGEPTQFEACRSHGGYVLFGQETPPYLHSNGRGGARLFEAQGFLHKTPLWRLDADVLINSYEKTHLRFTDVSTALPRYNPTNVASCGRDAVRAAR